MKTPNGSSLNHGHWHNPLGNGNGMRRVRCQRVRPWRRLARAVCGSVTAVLGLAANLAVAQVSLLHTFTGGTDGSQPIGTLALADTNLYGMASSGSGSVRGTVFKLNTDGTSFAILHSFAGYPGDGSAPSGSLTLSASTLYGMTSSGGSTGWGMVFRLNSDGTGYTNLHNFANDSNGRSPYGSLTLSGSTLFGMTGFGGSGNNGTIFKLNTDGTGFALLHSFAGGTSDGSQPFYGALTLSGSTLYGMTKLGGSGGGGTVFKMNTNGTGFSLLHSFAGGANDGRQPHEMLTLSGSTLYGMTCYGGSNDVGVLFKINTDGSGFSVMHSFASGTNDGASPVRSLTLSGSMLYGMTQAGGNGNGTMFQINTDGTGFTLLHRFTGGSSGASPQGNVTVLEQTLYGVTYGGGAYGNGTAFSLSQSVSITATAGSHGTILPAGAVTVPVGSTTNFVITPNPYGHVADVTTNGVSVGAVTAFTWPNITAAGSINATFAPDLAAGGTPDWWLAAYGWTNSFDAAEASDTDGDGFTAGQEYIAGTNPTDTSSALRILDMRMAPPQITFLSATNRLYTLYGRPDLAAGNWVPVSNQTDILGNGGLLTLVDSNTPAVKWFYRVGVRLP